MHLRQTGPLSVSRSAVHPYKRESAVHCDSLVRYLGVGGETIAPEGAGRDLLVGRRPPIDPCVSGRSLPLETNSSTRESSAPFSGKTLGLCSFTSRPIREKEGRPSGMPPSGESTNSSFFKKPIEFDVTCARPRLSAC